MFASPTANWLLKRLQFPSQLRQKDSKMELKETLLKIKPLNKHTDCRLLQLLYRVNKYYYIHYKYTIY